MRLAKRRRVGHDDPMAVVTRFLDAANHHDADTLYASVHPAFESFQPLHPDRNFRGPGQLISNWKAIFDAEPGFRLTVLRASTTGNTVWVELHGAGDSSEAAGIFIVGVENGRIRWVRVYSDLVESVAEQEPAEGTPSVGPTATEPSSAAAEPDAAARFADDAPMFRPAVAADSPTVEHEGGDSEAAPTGALRLVEPSDQPVPETGIASESPDPGLRLVDRSAASSEVGDGSEADAGPVETLVGPSRTVSATPGATWPPESSPTEAVPGDSVPTEAVPAEAEGPDAAATDDDPAPDVSPTEPDDEPPSAIAEPSDAADDDQPYSSDPVEPRSFDIGSRPQAPEPVLSRLRKAFRKP